MGMDILKTVHWVCDSPFAALLQNNPVDRLLGPIYHGTTL